MFNPRIFCLGVLLLTGGVAGAQVSPNGDEFQINTYTTGSQTFEGGAAADAQGRFVITWGGGPDGIQAQRFDSQARPVGGEFAVSSDWGGDPKVAKDTAGNFVVAWNEWSYPSLDVRARRFDADGAALGADFQVNTQPIVNAWYYIGVLDVAADAPGNFVVAWTGSGSSPGPDTSGYSIQGRRFDADGNPLGDQFQVNTYTTWGQNNASVSMDADGNFVIVWDSAGSAGTDTSGLSIQGQRYDASGAPLGAEFQVNTYTTGFQAYPEVATDSAGNFVVVWSSGGSSGTDTDSSSVQAQRFAAGGTPVGEQFQVNTYTTGWQTPSDVTFDARGNFLVTWFGHTGLDTDVSAQRFDSNGAPIETEFQVNTYTTSHQLFGAVVTDPQGNFVIAWESWGSSGTDTSYASVQARRFDDMFRDGFETGDTARWSGTVP